VTNRMKGTNTTKLYIPSNALIPGSTYSFQLQGHIEGSPAESAMLTTLLTTPPSPRLKASITGDGTQPASTAVDLKVDLIEPANKTVLNPSLATFSWTLISCPGTIQFTKLTSKLASKSMIGDVSFVRAPKKNRLVPLWNQFDDSLPSL